MSELPRVPYPGVYKHEATGQIAYCGANGLYPFSPFGRSADEWVLLEEQDDLMRSVLDPLPHLPADANVGIKVLRRYMDYCKYEDLVRRGALHMSTPQQLHDLDPHEGRHVQYRVPHNAAGDRVYRGLRAWTAESLERFFVSCWCELPEESERMWGQYTKSSDSVVVVTTPLRIARSLRYPRDVRLHRVQYTVEPYLVDCSPGYGDVHATILHKRLEFQGEREVRLIAEKDARISIARVNVTTAQRTEGWQPGPDRPPHLLHIESSAIAEVRAHPEAADALVDRIEALHRLTGATNVKVGRSDL